MDSSGTCLFYSLISSAPESDKLIASMALLNGDPWRTRTDRWSTDGPRADEWFYPIRCQHHWAGCQSVWFSTSWHYCRKKIPKTGHQKSSDLPTANTKFCIFMAPCWSQVGYNFRPSLLENHWPSAHNLSHFNLNPGVSLAFLKCSLWCVCVASPGATVSHTITIKVFFFYSKEW